MDVESFATALSRLEIGCSVVAFVGEGKALDANATSIDATYEI